MGTVCRCRMEIQKKHFSIFMFNLLSYAGVLITVDTIHHLPNPAAQLRLNEPHGSIIGTCCGQPS